MIGYIRGVLVCTDKRNKHAQLHRNVFRHKRTKRYQNN